MEKALQVFKHDAFGNIRWLLINNIPYFVGKDVADALGYQKARNALKVHVDEEDKKVAPDSGRRWRKARNDAGKRKRLVQLNSFVKIADCQKVQALGDK